MNIDAIREYFQPIIVENSDVPSWFDFLGTPMTIFSIFPFIFVSPKKRINQYSKDKQNVLLNRDKIYFKQCLETAVIGYFVIFFFEFFCNYLKYMKVSKAYEQIRFQQESRDNKLNLNYLEERNCYSWINYPLFPDLNSNCSPCNTDSNESNDESNDESVEDDNSVENNKQDEIEAKVKEEVREEAEDEAEEENEAEAEEENEAEAKAEVENDVENEVENDVENDVEAEELTF